MNEIIEINYETDIPTVSGRELHEALGVKTAYKDWFPRMCEYGFTEGEDFNLLKNEQVRVEGNRQVVREISDHQLTIPMAKEICMLQRNEKGKMFRQYFIKVEEAWNSPEQVMARALRLADKTISQIKLQIEEQKPLVDFATKVSDSSNLIDMGKMAKLLKDEDINIGRNRLFSWLRKKKILMSNNMPYQQYVDGGYFHVKESVFDTPYGTKTQQTTMITGKGQIYITEKLRKEWK